MGIRMRKRGYLREVAQILSAGRQRWVSDPAIVTMMFYGIANRTSIGRCFVGCPAGMLLVTLVHDLVV